VIATSIPALIEVELSRKWEGENCWVANTPSVSIWPKEQPEPDLGTDGWTTLDAGYEKQEKDSARKTRNPREL